MKKPGLDATPRSGVVAFFPYLPCARQKLRARSPILMRPAE